MDKYGVWLSHHWEFLQTGVYLTLTYLSPKGKGRKLAWQGAWHENRLMLIMRMHVLPNVLPNLLPLATCRRCPPGGLSRGHTDCEPARRAGGRRGEVKYEVSFRWRFQPPNRRKFRSQTSDNMDRWKSRGVKSQGGEKKREDQRRERERRKKMQVREKVGKSQVAQAGRKVGSLKRRVRSQLAK